MSEDLITITHPQHGEVLVNPAQWNQVIPDGELSQGGWDEKSARAAGWGIKGEAGASAPKSDPETDTAAQSAVVKGAPRRNKG